MRGALLADPGWPTSRSARPCRSRATSNLITEPRPLRYLVVAAAAPQKRFTGPPRDVAVARGTVPASTRTATSAGLFARHSAYPDQRISVFPNETARVGRGPPEGPRV